MTRVQLSNKVGSALDPCAAIQVPFELQHGEERELSSRLGAGAKCDTPQLVQRFRGAGASLGELAKAEYWARTLGALQWKRPTVFMCHNGGLLYQTRQAAYGVARIIPIGALSGSGSTAGRAALTMRSRAPLASTCCAVRHLFAKAMGHWWHPPRDAVAHAMSETTSGCIGDIALCDGYERHRGADETITSRRPAVKPEKTVYDDPSRRMQVYQTVPRQSCAVAVWGARLPMMARSLNDGMTCRRTRRRKR